MRAIGPLLRSSSRRDSALAIWALSRWRPQYDKMLRARHCEPRVAAVVDLFVNGAKGKPFHASDILPEFQPDQNLRITMDFRRKVPQAVNGPRSATLPEKSGTSGGS